MTNGSDLRDTSHSDNSDDSNLQASEIVEMIFGTTRVSIEEEEFLLQEYSRLDEIFRIYTIDTKNNSVLLRLNRVRTKEVIYEVLYNSSQGFTIIRGDEDDYPELIWVDGIPTCVIEDDDIRDIILSAMYYSILGLSDDGLIAYRQYINQMVNDIPD